MGLGITYARGLLDPGIALLERGSSLAHGLVFYAPLTEYAEVGAHEWVSGIHNASGFIHIGVSKGGYSRYHTGGGQWTFGFYDRYKFATGPFTVAFYGMPDTAASALNAISNLTASGPTSQWRLICNFNGTAASSGWMTFWTSDSVGNSHTEASGVIDSNTGGTMTIPHWYIGVRRSDGTLQLWRDNVLMAENAGATARDVSGTNTQSVKTGFTTGGPPTGRMLTRFTLWNRAINGPEIAELVVNSDALIRRRKIVVPVTAPAASSQPPRSMHQFRMRRAA